MKLRVASTLPLTLSKASCHSDLVSSSWVGHARKRTMTAVAASVSPVCFVSAARAGGMAVRCEARWFCQRWLVPALK